MWNAGSAVDEARGRFGRRWLVLALVLLGIPLLGAPCGQEAPPGERGPEVSVTLNAVADELNDLLIVPPSGFAINVSWLSTEAPVAGGSLRAGILDSSQRMVWTTSAFTLLPSGGVTLFLESETLFRLPPDSYWVWAEVADDRGFRSSVVLQFAVREFPASPPIGQGQVIWYDFEADRDAEPGPDFAVDLEYFGLASSGAPDLSTSVREMVIGALLDRVAEVYHQDDPNGLGFSNGSPDPVQVTFTTSDLGDTDTTRICIGGADPSGRGAIGSILIDPGNSNRSGEECGTLPPSGIFPRHLLAFSSSSTFQALIDPLRPAAGGTPVGGDPLDAIVLDPGFDPATATSEELARRDAIDAAVGLFADALGSIVAHETGHALGLVAPAAPGVGLYGGQTGAEFTHNVMPDGSSPIGNYLMNAGNTFSLDKLAGRAGHSRPGLRPLNFAYLRDRAVIDPRVTAILPPPVVNGVSPPLVADWLVVLTITGEKFVDTPEVRLIGEDGIYDCIGETLVSAQEMTATVVKLQVYAGTYDLELTNPDGLKAVLPASVEILP